jgi:hypothetical protein
VVSSAVANNLPVKIILLKNAWERLGGQHPAPATSGSSASAVSAAGTMPTWNKTSLSESE